MTNPKELMPDHSDEEIRQIARDFYDRKIFSNFHLDDQSLLGSIFIPLSFLEEADRKSILDSKPAMIYEYLDHAGPRAINGYPMFFSARLMSQRDTQRVLKLVDNMEKAMALIEENEVDSAPAYSEEEIRSRLASYCVANRKIIVFHFYPPISSDVENEMFSPDNWVFNTEQEEDNALIMNFTCSPFAGFVTAKVKVNKKKTNIIEIEVGTPLEKKNGK